MAKPVCLITGAGRGIGAATAEELDRLGWRLALISRTASELQSVCARCADAISIEADVTRSTEVQRAVEAAMAAFGRIDAAVNCAGSAPLAPIETTTDEQFREAIDANLAHVFYVTRALWPHFKRQKSGCIVNLSSFSSRDPFNGFGAYAAAKAGINLFSLVASREGAADGIRVHVVAPGAVETQMLRQNFSENVLPAGKTLAPSAVAKVIAQIVAGDLACTSGEIIWVHR